MKKKLLKLPIKKLKKLLIEYMEQINKKLNNKNKRIDKIKHLQEGISIEEVI